MRVKTARRVDSETRFHIDNMTCCYAVPVTRVQFKIDKISIKIAKVLTNKFPRRKRNDMKKGKKLLRRSAESKEKVPYYFKNKLFPTSQW
jgi:hypothetical protein